MKDIAIKNEAIKRYKSGESPSAIQQDLGITRNVFYYILRREGVETKRTLRKWAGKQCPACKKTIEVKGAKFCCFCGADIRSAAELIVEKVKRLTSIIQLLPSTSRDETMEILSEVTEYLEKDLVK